MAYAKLCKALVLAVFLTGAFSDRSIANERVALVIGNSAYEHTEPLQAPRNDAIDMSRILRDLGFEVIEGHDLDQAAFEVKLQDFARAAADAETALVYYSGHGLQVDGTNYLVPVDAALASEADLHLEVTSLETVMSSLRSRTNILILDACRFNPLAGKLADSMGPDRSNAVGRGLARMEGAANTLITFATEPGTVTDDGDRRSSPFAESLLANLAVPGVGVHDLMATVRDEVATQTARQQQPWTQSSLRQPFFFNPVSVTETVDRSLVEAAGAETEASAGAQTADGTGAGAHEATERESPASHSDPEADVVSEGTPAEPALQDIPGNGEAGAEQEDATAGAPSVAPIAAPENVPLDTSSDSMATALAENVFVVDFGRDGNKLAHNGSCEDIRFFGNGMGETAAVDMIGRDATDCRTLLENGRIRLHSLWGGPRDPVKFGDDGSERAHDQECDDLRFSGNGMGKSLLAGDIGRDATDCRSLFEQGRIRLHPLFGIPGGRLEFGDNGSGTAYDGECDDPRFDGNGMAKTLLAGNMGHDAVDCRILHEQGGIRLRALFLEPGDGLDFGDDGSNWANDEECDDPRFVGDGMADQLVAEDVGQDAADCRSLFEEDRIRMNPLYRGPGDVVKYGDDGGEWVRDGECGDPRFVGDGMAETPSMESMGQDAADCRSLFERGQIRRHPLFGDPDEPLDFGDDGSDWANDGECDDLRFVGDGMARNLLVENMGRDAADCRSLFEEEQIRLHPQFGGPGVSLDFGDDGSDWANDGECDDPRFAGDGVARNLLVENMGRDAADCRSLFEQGRIEWHPLFEEPWVPPVFGDNGSEWANDGECDDLRFVGDGMAETLLVEDMGRDAADCRSLFEEGLIRLHPLSGGRRASFESTRPGDPVDFGYDGSEWANDGECDDPRFVGDGMAETLLAEDLGRDASDCRRLFELGQIRLRPEYEASGTSRESPLSGSFGDSQEFGDDSSQWANDGECDDPRFVGDGMATTLLAEDLGRDASDCRNLFELGRIRLKPEYEASGTSRESPLSGSPGGSLDFGDDSSQWSNDGECDDPRFVGDGMAETLLAEDLGRDASDCRRLFELGQIWLRPEHEASGTSRESPLSGSPGGSLDFGDDSSQWSNDGECDDPRFVGDGMAEILLAEDLGRDASDCRALFERGLIRLNGVGG